MYRRRRVRRSCLGPKLFSPRMRHWPACRSGLCLFCSLRLCPFGFPYRSSMPSVGKICLYSLCPVRSVAYVIDLFKPYSIGVGRAIVARYLKFSDFAVFLHPCPVHLSVRGSDCQIYCAAFHVGDRPARGCGA